MARLYSVIALAVALSATGSNALVPSSRRGDDPTLTLRVVNESWNEIDVYAVNGWSRQRIVHLCGKGRAEVEVGEPWLSYGEIVFFADAVSSEGTFMTPPITVIGDTYVDITLPEDVTKATYRVHYGYDLEETETDDGGAL
jgi:hypothetical protein